ncbi:Peroxidase 5-like protein [Drosera capensis]
MRTTLAFLVGMSMVAASMAGLQEGFYNSTCPSAESIVKSVVYDALDSDVTLGAALVRLLFHDCFVRGCDASVLIAPTDSEPSERSASINLSLRGFSVIEDAKIQLEAACPETVSCADIVAFAARDSALKLGGINYTVAAGRRDGLVSNVSDPLLNLPQFTYNLSQLTTTFAKKGLSVKDMVILSGAHSIGAASCASFSNRIYPTVDATLKTTFAESLEKLCPNGSTATNVTTYLDYQTPAVLDNKYYQDILDGKVLLTSDEDLAKSNTVLTLVERYASDNDAWATLFAAAMQKMGKIDVLTGTEGNIRLNCSAFNSDTDTYLGEMISENRSGQETSNVI